MKLTASAAPLALLVGLGVASALPDTARAQSTEESTTVDSVIVTAQRNPDEPAVVADARVRLSRTPGAVAIVASETYEDRLATGFADTLRNVPGVMAQKRYGEESRLSIRGSGIAQGFHQRGVLFAQDGVPFADADGFSDFQGVDTQSARYIEVYKGSNTLRFGGAQLGGTVNLVTPTGLTAPSNFLLRAETGSFGTTRVHAEVALQRGNWDLFVGASGLWTDGYRLQSEQSQGRITINLGYSFGDDREVRLLVQSADINQEVPSGLTLADALDHPKSVMPANLVNDYARDQTLDRVSLQTRWRFNDNLTFEGGLWTWRKDLYHPIFQVVDQDSETWGAFGRFDWLGEVFGRKADLFFGFSYRDGDLDARRYVNVGGDRGVLTSSGVQLATGLDVFAEGRVFITPRFVLVAGGSLGGATRDYRDRLNPANDDSIDYNWFSPRLGLLWQDDAGVQVFANVTRSVEPPHYGALVQAPLTGFTPVDYQDAWTVELGTRGRRGAFTWDVAVYRSEIDGEILNFIVGPGIPAATFNADRTVHQGIEAGLDWRLPWNPLDVDLTLRQTYTLNDFRFDGDARWGDNRLPVAPRHQYRAELTFERGDWRFTPAVEWRADGTWVDYANTLKAPGYTVLSATAGWSPRPGVSLFVDARNLTGEHYTPEFSAITDAGLVSTAVFFPGEGRAVFAGVSWRF